MKTDLKRLKTNLEKIDKELDKCRTSSFVDGWQTQKHARKSRKWDMLAQEKMNIIKQIEEYEKFI